LAAVDATLAEVMVLEVENRVEVDLEATRLENTVSWLLIRAAYILDQSEEFAKTGQKSLHEYFAPISPQQKAYKNITEPRRTTQLATAKPKISIRYIH